MATTYATTATIRQWPALLKPSDITLHPRHSTGTFTSPYTGTSQTTALPGALWQLDAAFPAVPRSQRPAYRAFLASLQGGAGRFIFPALTCRYAPRAIGAPLRVTWIGLTVDTTHITADTTRVTADAATIPMETVFAASTCPDDTHITGTLWLNSGQYPLHAGSPISWDDATGWRHLHIVTELHRHGDAAGTVTLTVEPPMRERPTPATPIDVHAPSAIFRLADDGQGALRQSGISASFQLAAVQAFPLQVSA